MQQQQEQYRKMVKESALLSGQEEKLTALQKEIADTLKSYRSEDLSKEQAGEKLKELLKKKKELEENLVYEVERLLLQGGNLKK